MLELIPFGTLVFAWCTLMAVAPIRSPRPLGLASWISGSVVNELPFLFLCIVVGSGVPELLEGGLGTARGAIGAGVAFLTAIGLAVVIRRALTTRDAVQAALREALGASRLEGIDVQHATQLRRRPPWARILLLPWPFRPRDVERTKNLAYADGGKDNLLDVYRHRSHPAAGPTLVFLHGGSFRRGDKNREARPLIHHLARQGWTCISANYHLSPSPAEGYPEHLIDVKRVLAWARTEGRAHGVDPNMIVLVGSSSGAHLAAMAALTANDARFQPGFEAADTSVQACVGLYGYYGPLGADEDTPSTPLAYDAAEAPPMFVAHGTHDTFTPIAGARQLVDHVRSTSPQPVVFVELAGGQHSFDLFHSIRFEAVVDGIERFAAWVRSQQDGHGERRSRSGPASA